MYVNIVHIELEWYLTVMELSSISEIGTLGIGLESV